MSDKPYKLAPEFRNIVKRFSTDFFTLELKDKKKFPNVKIDRSTWKFETIVPLTSEIINIFPSE